MGCCSRDAAHHPQAFVGEDDIESRIRKVPIFQDICGCVLCETGQVFFTKSSSFSLHFPAYSDLLYDNSGDDDMRRDDLTRTHSKQEDFFFFLYRSVFIHSDKVGMI